MNILSLFDGMSCGQIAFEELGMKVNRYVAYEIDKYPIKVTQHNYPNTEQMGDVFTADFTQYKGFDWLIGGSPCTYWSIAQKNNRETVASGMGWELFSQYVRALKEAQPKYFLYENNKSMSNAIRESITETFGFEPICINSALVSAQNRQRLYWVGIRQPDGTYKKADVQQPDDRGILLKDILETGFDLSSKDKAYTLTASYNGAVAWNTIERNQRTMVAEPTRIPEYGENEKSRPLSASYANKGEGEGSLKCDAFPDNPAKQVFDYVAQRINEGIKRIGGLYGQVTRWGIYDETDKSPTLTASMGMGGGHVPMITKETASSKTTDKNPTDKIQIYEIKDGKITIKGKQYPIKLKDGYYIIRKLTVTECKRLQTVPEWYDMSVISNSQAYKCLGNGWTVEVIKHLINSALETEKE